MKFLSQKVQKDVRNRNNRVVCKESNVKTSRQKHVAANWTETNIFDDFGSSDETSDCTKLPVKLKAQVEFYLIDLCQKHEAQQMFLSL